LAAGEYEIRVVITDHITRETISPTVKFTVVK